MARLSLQKLYTSCTRGSSSCREKVTGTLSSEPKRPPRLPCTPRIRRRQGLRIESFLSSISASLWGSAAFKI